MSSPCLGNDRWFHSTGRQGRSGESWGNAAHLQTQPKEKNMKLRFYLYTAVLLALAAGTAGNSLGQATASGTIQGTVTDQTQAVITEADVAITSKATGEKRAVRTNETGYYRFDLLSAGAYTVRISKSGFKELVQNVELLVGQTLTASGVLTPGTTTEVIEVTAAAPLVDIAKTSVSQNITPTEVEELPMVGRDVANLA